jgi:signal recognition particle receptor subunit beta
MPDVAGAGTASWESAEGRATVRYGKVVVLGPAEAGKSTLIQALTLSSMNLAIHGRTVAMDHGMLERDGVALSIVGVPGQDRFAPVRASLIEGARVAIWVHPAGEGADQVTAALVSELAGAGIPYLVFVNEREGVANRNSWSQLPGLPPPREVICGDARLSRAAARNVKDALWDLVFAQLREGQLGG